MNGKQRLSNWTAGLRGLALTLGIAFLLAIGCMVLLSKEPAAAIYYFFIGPFTNGYALGNMLNTAIPLIFTGLGIALATGVGGLFGLMVLELPRPGSQVGVDSELHPR